MKISPNSLSATVRPYKSLNAALESIIACLNIAVPFRMWLVTRVNGNDQTVMAVIDHKDEIQSGLVVNWSDSFCQHMVAENAPPVVVDVQSVASYRDAGANRHMRVGAYLGQPLTMDDGSLIGTLCAIDPEIRPQLLPDQIELINHLSRIASTLISSAMEVEKFRQIEAGLRYQANTDALTKLANRNAWAEAIIDEEHALNALAENAMVAIIDLDGLKQINDSTGHVQGDAYLIRAARSLLPLVQAGHLVARIGGDEFAVLARGLNAVEGNKLRAAIVSALDAAGVNASIGIAMRCAHGSLQAALHEADALMYEEKAIRRRTLLQTDLPCDAV